MIIDAVEFIRPNGRKRTMQISLPGNDLEQKWHGIQARGCRLTLERIGLSRVSVCIEEPDTGDFLIELVNDTGGDISRAVEKLIEDFDFARYSVWYRSMTEEP